MKKLFTILFLLAAISYANAQDTAGTVRVAPGPDYKAGVLHRMIFGNNWRDVWTTPISVPTLDLGTFAGGLTPTKTGGGLQTKSIRFAAGNGKEYKFRSIDKDPGKVLPTALRHTFIAKIAKDFISTVHPIGALITTPILDAAEVLNTPYLVCMLPNDDRLGEFKGEFGGILGMLEENPHSSDDEGGGGFAGADKIKGTLDVYAKLDEDNDDYIDAVAFLKARILDVYFGDWDRHYDQWRWAGYKEGKKTRWVPIPRDRDQAFCRFHGFIPFLLAVNIMQIESTDDSYPELVGLTWNGRHLDRRFLSSIEKPVWDSLATFVHTMLTDSLIEYSVHRIPEEMFEKSGEELIHIMKARRNNLRKAIDEFYELLAEYVDIWASNKSEYVTVNRVSDDTVIVELFKRDKETGGAKEEPFFHRAFDRDHTSELRIYLQDGDDFAKVEGSVTGSILTRIIGGDGKDELVDSSNVKGHVFGIFPFSRTKTIFYDHGDKGEFVYGSSTKIDNSKFVRPPEDSLLYEPLYRDWGHKWHWLPWVNYTSDDGVFLGLQDLLREYSFRSIPFQARMLFQGGYAFKAQRFIAQYQAQFPDIWKGTIWIDAHVSGLGALNYFGLGNETKYSPSGFDRSFYTIKERLYVVAPSYEYELFPHCTIRGTAALRYIQTPLAGLPDSSYLKLTNPYGTGDHLFSSFTASGIFDSRNSVHFPERGVLLSATSTWTPEFTGKPAFIGNKYAYTKAIGDARIYLTANILGGTTLALRVHGEKIWGKYPFFDASYLGGANDLRGFYRERFAGDASFFGAAELRVNLGKFRIFVPGDFGFTIGAETGKVFVEKQVSQTFHTSINWGVWIAPVKKDFLLALTVASSQERTAIYVGGQFGF